MAQMDFLERLVLDAIGSKYMEGTVAQSPLLGEKRSIAVSPSPSNDYDYYFDGSYRQGYAFRVLVKDQNQLVAYNTCNQIITDLIKLLDIPSQNGTYTYEGMSITTDTNMIGEDNKHFVFGAQLSASLFIKP